MKFETDVVDGQLDAWDTERKLLVCAFPTEVTLCATDLRVGIVGPSRWIETIRDSLLFLPR